MLKDCPPAHCGPKCVTRFGIPLGFYLTRAAEVYPKHAKGLGQCGWLTFTVLPDTYRKVELVCDPVAIQRPFFGHVRLCFSLSVAEDVNPPARAASAGGLFSVFGQVKRETETNLANKKASGLLVGRKRIQSRSLRFFHVFERERLGRFSNAAQTKDNPSTVGQRGLRRTFSALSLPPRRRRGIPKASRNPTLAGPSAGITFIWLVVV